MKSTTVLLVSLLITLSLGEVLFHEDFSGDWESRWIQSKAKSDFGKFKQTGGKFVGRDGNVGVQTSQDARFYAIGTKFDGFSNKEKDLVVQFVVKHEQNIDCGGGYIKILPADSNLEGFTGDSKYNIMFGPDICGPPTKKIHLIFNYKGENLLWKKTPSAQSDELSHLYTMILKPDNTYKVLVDNKEVAAGNLADDWEFLEPKEIPDPEAKKPSDWVDARTIPDVTDTKPADWDDEPAEIPDPDATKPDDWDDDADGEWVAPTKDNPKFKGVWRQKTIPNPDYKGEWVHPKIANPEYVEDSNLYLYESFGAVAIDIWQVKSGTVFDEIQFYDDIEEASNWAKNVFLPEQAKEKEIHDKAEAERREKEEAERKAAAEAAKADEDEDEDTEDDDHDHDGHDHDEL